MEIFKKYQIALSFAGEDRNYVGEVAELLKLSGINVFYDSFEEDSLWGKNLYDHLSDIYQNQAEYTIMFISEHYAKKLWTNHERQAMQARAFKESKEYILPARFDKTNIPGLIGTIGYIDLKNKTPQEFVKIIEKKLSKKGLFEPGKKSKNVISTSKNSMALNKFETSIEDNVDYILNDLSNFFKKINARIPKYDWLGESLKNFDDVQKKWNDRRFQVAIMALIKSGKSTLLNSWIGNEFLPSASVTETMRIIRIRHNARRRTGALIENDKVLARGVDNIRGYIRKLNEEERSSNKKTVKNELRLEFNLSSLKGKKLLGYGFDLIDTPGVNESGIQKLQDKIEQMVKNSDVIIYLLDFTKLKTVEEKNMLESLKEWKNEILDELKNRLFFVVNKIDSVNRHDREKNMTKDQIKDYVRVQLSDSLDIKVNRENIILVSSERALLSRLVEKEMASEEQLNDFKEIAFGAIGAYKANIEECKKAVPEIIESSGFAELEKKVINTIYEKRSQILISSVLDDIEGIVTQAINNLEVGKAALHNKAKDITNLKKRITILENELEEIKKRSLGFKKKIKKINKR